MHVLWDDLRIFPVSPGQGGVEADTVAILLRSDRASNLSDGGLALLEHAERMRAVVDFLHAFVRQRRDDLRRAPIRGS